MSIPQIIAIETIAEAVKNLLLPLVTNGSGVMVVERRFKTPDQVDVAQTPAVYILQGPITNIRDGGKPAIQIITFWIFVYTNPAPVDVLPSTTLNDAIQSVLNIVVNKLFPYGEQTLGGLVSNCWVEGDILYDSGEVQPPGLAVIPLKVKVPTLAI